MFRKKTAAGEENTGGNREDQLQVEIVSLEG